jgi:hypothetical protein
VPRLKQQDDRPPSHHHTGSRTQRKQSKDHQTPDDISQPPGLGDHINVLRRASRTITPFACSDIDRREDGQRCTSRAGDRSSNRCRAVRPGRTHHGDGRIHRTIQACDLATTTNTPHSRGSNRADTSQKRFCVDSRRSAPHETLKPFACTHRHTCGTL